MILSDIYILIIIGCGELLFIQWLKYIRIQENIEINWWTQK